MSLLHTCYFCLHQIADSSSYLSGKDESNIKVMLIQDILKSEANVSITVTANDLIQYSKHLIQATKEELENTISIKNEETYITPREACAQLRVDRSTLTRWAKSKYLVAIETGGKRLYKQSDINKILQK